MGLKEDLPEKWRDNITLLPKELYQMEDMTTFFQKQRHSCLVAVSGIAAPFKWIQVLRQRFWFSIQNLHQGPKKLYVAGGALSRPKQLPPLLVTPSSGGQSLKDMEFMEL